MDPDKVYDRAIRLLAVREHSEAELKRKLLARNLPELEILAAIKKAREAGFVDDARFAREFARYAFKQKGWAPSRTGMELQKRGVDRELIDQAVSEVFADADPKEQARELALSRVRRMTGDTESCRRRLVSYLSRRGYSTAVCRDVVDEVAPLQ